MAHNFFSPQFRWTRYLALARVLLSFSALLNEFSTRAHQSLLFSVALVLFLGFSILVGAGPPARGSVFGLLALFADTVFFLIVTNHLAGHLAWFPTVFYLFLIAEAVAFYSAREVLMVVGISAGFCAAVFLADNESHMDLLLRTVLVAGTVAVAFAINKRRLENRIEQLQQDLEGARDAAHTAADAAQQKIAADFHDGPLQSFISHQMRLEILRKLLERDRDAGMVELKQLQELAQTQVRDLRAFIRGLRGPVDVDDSNLFVSARRLAENFQKDSGIPVTFIGSDTPLSIPAEACTELLQMLRESLNNVQKHAQATRVAIAIARHENRLEISVDDNGKGFPFSGTYNLEELELLRLGPASIKRRARAINAELLLESRPSRGVGLKIRVPV